MKNENYLLMIQTSFVKDTLMNGFYCSLCICYSYAILNSLNTFFNLSIWNRGKYIFYQLVPQKEEATLLKMVKYLSCNIFEGLIRVLYSMFLM